MEDDIKRWTAQRKSDGGVFAGHEQKNTVHRIFQIKGWQVRKRLVGLRPRIQALSSLAAAPDQRWATDLCRVWAGRDGWAHLALVIDCHTRELLGWHLSRRGNAKTAESALEQALIAHYGCLRACTPKPFLLRSDNGLIFTSRRYTALVKGYGLRQEFVTLHSPELNGLVERVIRTLKDTSAYTGNASRGCSTRAGPLLTGNSITTGARTRRWV